METQEKKSLGLSFKLFSALSPFHILVTFIVVPIYFIYSIFADISFKFSLGIAIFLIFHYMTAYATLESLKDNTVSKVLLSGLKFLFGAKLYILMFFDFIVFIWLGYSIYHINITYSNYIGWGVFIIGGSSIYVTWEALRNFNMFKLLKFFE